MTLTDDVPTTSAPGVQPLPRERLTSAKPAYTTRHVDLDLAAGLLVGAAPEVGDLVLATVTGLGQHVKLELPDGRRASLFPGDEVVVAYGHRYAPDQFEAEVPPDLGPCELVAAGGLAARVLASHGKMRPATTLAPVGLLVDATGRRVSLSSVRGAAPAPCAAEHRPITVAVAGAAMNSGKTTTATHLVRGLRLAGLRVGAAKVTGTGAGGDVWMLGDAGAFPVYDFTNAGVPSTYRVDPEGVVDIFTELTDRLAEDGCEVVVLEVADGVYQDESAALLADPRFADRVDGVVFASYDALGATAGTQWLRDNGLDPMALSGVLSSSPLATREAVAATGLPVWGLAQLEDPEQALAVFTSLRDGRRTPPADAPEPHDEVELAVAAQPEGGAGATDPARSA